EPARAGDGRRRAARRHCRRAHRAHADRHGGAPVTRNGLSPAALERVRDAITPGGQVTRVRPLRGGVSASVHLVHLIDTGGQRHVVVVRRYGDHYLPSTPSPSEREFKVLEVLERAAYPAPRPLLVEAEGGPFGRPTVVMTRLPGRPSV